MARGKLRLIAALSSLIASAWAQSPSESCYLTSTVIYGAQSTLQTFSSMSSPPPPVSSTPSPMGVTSTGTSTSSTSSSEPTLPLSTPVILQAFTSLNKARRAMYYAAIGEDGYVVLQEGKESAASFIIFDGFLLTGQSYVGPHSSCEDCSVPLQLSDVPLPRFFNWVFDGTTVSYGSTTFCFSQISLSAPLQVIFGSVAPDLCLQVSLVPEPAPTSSTSVIASTAATDVSSTASTATSAPSESSIGPILSSAASSSSATSALQSSSSPGAVSSSAVVSSSATRLPTSHSSSTSTVSLVTSSSFLLPSSSTSSTSGANPSLSSSTSPSLSSSSTTPTSSTRSSSLSSSSLSQTLTSSSTSSSVQSSSPSSAASSSTSPSSSTTHSSSSLSTPASSSTTRSSTSSSTSASSPSATPTLSGKRGLAYSNVNYTYFYPRPDTQVSWAYNYYYNPLGSSNVGTFPRTTSYPLRFNPLLFNDDAGLAANWPAGVNYSITNYGTDAIFSFNEPDLCGDGSACMTVSRALVAYQKSMQPFAGRVRLAAPAITNAGSGFVWLKEFLGNASLPQWNLTIDIINIHWYASPYSMDYFVSYMDQANVIAAGRPIWITEYGMDQTYNEAAVLQFIRNSTYYCDHTSFIERYAWFGNYANNLITSGGTGLSPRGQIWNNYTGTNYVYGFPSRVAGSMQEARVGEGDGDIETIKQRSREADPSEWDRGNFVERMWWKQDGHMDKKMV